MEENIIQCKQNYYDVYAALVESRGIENAYTNIMQYRDTNKEANEDRTNLIKELDVQIKNNKKQREQLLEQSELYQKLRDEKT
jgi:hypothetical protein